MVEYQDPVLDDVFHALGDPTRRGMIHDLSANARTVGELARPYAMSLAAASKHLAVLERSGLIRRDIQGRTHVCALEPAPLSTAMSWMRNYERFWSERLDALDALFRQKTKADDDRR